MEGWWKVRGRFVEGSWKVRGRLVEGWWKVLEAVKRRSEPHDHLPVEQLDEDAPSAREQHHQRRLGGGVQLGRVDLRPQRVQPDDHAGEQQQLRRERGDRDAPLEEALPPRVVQRGLAWSYTYHESVVLRSTTQYYVLRGSVFYYVIIKSYSAGSPVKREATRSPRKCLGSV